MPKEIRIHKSVLLILGIILSITLSYGIATLQKNANKKKLDDTISRAMNGKDQISDYNYEPISGNLVSTSSSPQGFTLPLFSDLKKQEDLKDIQDYYFLKKGGYSYITVKKYDTRIDYTEINLKDIGFISGNVKRDINQVYEQVINVLKDREYKASFTPNIYDNIELVNLITLINRFSFFKTDAEIEGGLKPSGKIYPNWDVLYDNYFLVGDKIVFYSKYTMNIYIEENKRPFIKRWAILSAIFVAVTLLAYVIKWHRPKISIT